MAYTPVTSSSVPPVTDTPTLPPIQEPPVARPTVKISSRAAVTDAIKAFLDASGKNTAEAVVELDAFVNRIAVRIDQQIDRMVSDPDVAKTNLGYLWGMVYAETGRVSLGIINRERAAVTAAVIGVVRGVLITAITA